MKCVAISDTHNKHDQLELPEADVLIHAGDFCGKGSGWEAKNFADWFVKQPHKYKVVIAGNHDLALERNDKFAKEIFNHDNVFYLFNSAVNIEGVNFWGSPYVPMIWGAFNLHRKDLWDHWKKIPSNVDVLVTHGPPFGQLDYCWNGQRAGCEALAKKVIEVKPQVHVFGHIHEEYGIKVMMDGRKYVNACSCNLQYNLVNKPLEFEVYPRGANNKD